ncbi:MAG: DUF6807 family protein [Planctomycetaceae bacterium]
MTARSVAGVLLVALLAGAAPAGARAADAWAVEARDAGLVITAGGRAVAEYRFGDDAMRRPGLANLATIGGTPVTRAFPPREGIDAVDHAAMHPGIWIAFGDVSGEDFWRNKGTIRHEGFAAGPDVGPDGVRFTARARLLAADGTPLGRMSNRVAIVDRPEGRVVAWLSTLEAGAAPLVLGDQEEMGFGVRVATGLEEKAGGRIVNARGAATAAGTWGREAEWCDTSGDVAGGGRAGITVVADPDNVRLPWWHTRDYGLLVANPFGRAALAKGPPSRVEVAAGGSLQLGFAAVLHDGPAGAPAGDDPAGAAARAAAALEVLRAERTAADAAR